MPARLLLKQARLVCPLRIIRSDLLIEDAFIAKIAPAIDAPGVPTLDCRELIALPGMIDAHVHFREPGGIGGASIRSESRAAVLGGVTSFMDMPNTQPPTTSAAALDDKLARAAAGSAANYAFYLGATADNAAALRQVPPERYPGIKIYLGATTGGLLVDDPEILRRIFAAAARPVCVHCEDMATVRAAEARTRETYGEAIPYALHAIIRGRDCCLRSTRLAVALAQDTHARLHVMHVSTVEEIALLAPFARGPLATRPISGEACIPHLLFSACDYDRLGGLLKCNPAVKTERDRAALCAAVERGILTTVGTDHAPHPAPAKLLPYARCPSGISSIQYALPALLELWRRHELTLETVARVSAAAPAERFGIVGRGRIEEGYYADLALINPLRRHEVTADEQIGAGAPSPFCGQAFSCRVEHTVVSGRLAVRHGVLDPKVRGLPLRFAAR